MAAFKSLVLEAKALQSLVKDLHGRLDPKAAPLTVPSRQFPGKTAIEVDFDSLLKEMCEQSSSSTDDNQRLKILELLMDRYTYIYLHDYPYDEVTVYVGYCWLYSFYL